MAASAKMGSPRSNAEDDRLGGCPPAKSTNECSLQQPGKNDGKTTEQKTKPIQCRTKRIRWSAKRSRTTRNRRHDAKRTTNANDWWNAKTRRTNGTTNALRRNDATTTRSTNGSSNAAARCSRSCSNQSNCCLILASCNEDRCLDLREEPLLEGESW